MRSLFFKIFIIFWLAQSLIFALSTTLIIRHRSPHPEFMLNGLFDDIEDESHRAASTFESRGCSGLTELAKATESVFILEDGNGTALCSMTSPFAVPGGITLSNGISGKEVGDRYFWRAPVTSRTGKRYIFLLWVKRGDKPHVWYQDVLHFAFPQLPIAIAVGGVTTFVLVMLFTRPVIRLRKAARELAQGNLSARVHTSGSPTRTAKGDEFRALVHDFNHMAERLQSLVDAQKLLLRDVSHELRSPLARLSVALELSREDADPGMTTHLDRIEREAERLNQLIAQLLTLSSMEAVEGLQTFESLPLQSLLEEILPDAEYEAKQRKASVMLDAECECMIEGRRELIYRAIENVVRNAIRYTEEGSEVEIRLHRSVESSVPMAIVEISDRGPGIPESELQSIFRPFYRVDQARSTNTGGVGVGLAIADRAVKLHNGQIRALNRQGGGATVQMRFRIAEAKDQLD
jgi:two-component system, OmpR family, sensor histidine kinase CpxA